MSWERDSSIRWYDVLGWIERLAGKTRSYPNLGQAVRWSDDPTQQMQGLSLFKFGGSMLSGCQRIYNNQGEVNITNGLLCNSHYGSMQFFHAQAEKPGESPVDTHDKIFGWAEFLYRVSQMTNEELDTTTYCGYFSGENVFHKAMLPERGEIHCGAPGDEGWTLTTLFNLKCDNAFRSNTCDEVGDTVRFTRTRIYAAGALLHMIQDSYSQSHCARGDCRRSPGSNKPESKVECVPITMFTTYPGQKRHGGADWAPRFASSCNQDSLIYDPITASAVALWHIQNKSDVGKFMEDLHRVFSTRADIARNASVAGFGDCFGPRAPLTTQTIEAAPVNAGSIP